MEKFLIVAHYSRFLVQFELNNVRLLQSLGYEVHYATNYKGEDMFAGAIKVIEESGVILHQVDFVRSPYHIVANVKAYEQLKRLMKKENFAGVHCHTPMAGALTRLAANAVHLIPVIYTAHGFHFYKGCSLKNRLIYRSAETFLARYTDAQITINQEDYASAKAFPLRGKAYFVPGVGIDINKIADMEVNREKKLKELGVLPEAKVFISVGELNENKNQATAIRAFARANIPNSVYLICGEGKLRESYERLIEDLKVSQKVRLLGFRTDVRELLKACDCFVFPSFREGLSVSLMEAMAAGIPCIASRIRGNVDLLRESHYLFEPTDEKEIARLMKEVADGVGVENECNQNSRVLEEYDIHNVQKKMLAIYTMTLGKGKV